MTFSNSGMKLNPAPHFVPNVPWKRHVIKKGGQNQHHDQVFGDFLGIGKPQLAFWNQAAKTLYLAEIPEHPRAAESCPLTEIVSATSTGATPYTEGMSAFDVDGDGQVDLLAFNTWYKHTGGKTFKPIKLANEGGLIFAGYFQPSKVAQIVISPGDGVGPLRWFECAGNPEDPKAWVGHDLIDRPVVHGHSLQLGDINRDAPRVDVWLNNGTRTGARGVGTTRSFSGPVGLQLYSLRAILGQNVGPGLQYARNFGFREVELAGTYGVPAAQFRAALSRFEMDVFWTVHSGQDPVKWLRKYPDRWALLHVKDIRQGVKTGLLTGSEDVRNDVALGSGQIDLPATLREARKAGVKHYFIEDESPVATRQIPQSLRYLESLNDAREGALGLPWRRVLLRVGRENF